MGFNIKLVKRKELYDTNHTSNTNEMFRLAFDSKLGIDVINSNEIYQAIPKVKEAIKYFKENKEELEKLNPENGWGSYDTALKLLENLLSEFKKWEFFDDIIVEVS